MYGEGNIISAVIPRRRDNYLLCDFVPIDQARIYPGENVIGDKRRKCAGPEISLEAMQRRVPRAKFLFVGSEKALFNGLDQRSFTKKMTASIKNVKTSYVT